MKYYPITYLFFGVILIITLSCKENNPGKEETKEPNKKTNLLSTSVLENFQTKWVSETKNGILIKKQMININNKPFINQIITYKRNGEIDSLKSNFYEIRIPDTLKLGKNIADINLYTYNKNYDTRYSYVIIENKYSESKIQLDTFGDIKKDFQFGIYAAEAGKLKIRGKIYEEILLDKKRLKNDSVSIELIKNQSFFEKEVYVKEI
jgi:hypothetical protein